jgi:tetratricopeptide (TPR) repeat protein
MDRREATLRVVEAGAELGNPAPVPSAEEALRWNDYGIGLLRQGDLQGARRAFGLVTAGDPGYADGWVNVGRVALREGLLDDAAAAMARALEIDPDLAKAHYFTGVVLKERGQYDEALAAFRLASDQYPRDRVVLNDIGRVLFLQRRYDEAVEALQAVLAVDPEDLMAHYNLMLCFKGLGRLEDAEAERTLYERFKADEDANILLGPYLRENPEDNRMRQPIREQVSAPADVIARELAARGANGDPHTVLPGQAEEYARRTVARGRAQVAEGQGSDRHRGPATAGEARGTK